MPRSLAPPTPVLRDDLFAVLLDDTLVSPASDGFDLVAQSSPRVGRYFWAHALALLLTSACTAAEPLMPLGTAPMLTVALGGDVMFGRLTPEGWRAHGAPELEEFAPDLRNADIAFANLETGICEQGRTQSRFPILQAPADSLDRLVDAGIDVVSIANNHVLDCGPDGIERTTNALTQRGISVAGVDPAVIGDVVVLAATMHRPPYAPVSESVLVVDEALPQRVTDLRKRYPDKLLIVSLHWGRERSSVVAPFQRELAHTLVDAGANLIAGHGPHTPQEREDYGGAPIFYSLGNLAFDDRSVIGRPVPPQLVDFARGPGRTWRVGVQ